MAPSNKDQVFIAITSGAAENSKTGEPLTFVQGQTRIAGDHWLLKQVPDCFEPIVNHLSYQNEAATKAPGEKRAAPAPAPAPEPEPAAEPGGLTTASAKGE